MPGQGFEDAVSQGVNDLMDVMPKAMATGLGMPPGGKQYTQAEVDAEWNYSPIADPHARVQTMLQMKLLGKTAEEITDMVYPNRRRLITTGRPRVSEQIAFAQQMDRRMAKLMGEYQQQAGIPAQPDTAVGANMPAPMMSPPASPPLPDPGPLPPAPAAASQPVVSMLDQPISMMGGG